MPGWGDHAWGPGPWGGEAVFTPTLLSTLMVAWDPVIPPRTGPATCRRAERFVLCDFSVEGLVNDDADPSKGGDGTYDSILQFIEGALFGTANQTGIMDDVASLPCVLDPAEAPPRFLDALLLHLGFNLRVPLSTDDKRRIIPLLVPLYRRRGTDVGIIQALSLLLGIPVEIIALNGDQIGAFECGEDFSRTLTDITPLSNFVRVDRVERFEVGENLVVIDAGSPFVDFPDTPINDIVADGVYFDPPGISGTIEAGAQVFCDRFCDQVGDVGFDLQCDEIGADDSFNSQDPALYSFYVDVQRTVQTTTDLEDGGTEVDVSDSDFIVVGSRVRLTDKVAPLQDPIVVEITEKDGLTIRFDPVSIQETIEAGADAINLFNTEEVSLINRIVEYARVAHTHHALTRDFGEAEVEIG